VVDSPHGPDVFDSLKALQQSEGSLTRPRWETDSVSVEFATTPNQFDEAAFGHLVSELATLEGVPRLVRAASGGSVVVHFLPKSRWAELGISAPDSETSNGYAKSSRQGDRLLDVVVVVDDSLDQTLRNRTLVHELIHALGLGHHDCAGGMMFGGAKYDPSWFLNEYDLTLLEAWYSKDPERTLRPLPCPAVSWDVIRSSSVSGNAGVLWCLRDTGDTAGGIEGTVQECYQVSPLTGPEREEGSLWYRSPDGGVSAHDPTRFIKVNSEGVYYLCHRPTASLRYATCEKDGLRTVSRVDAWFDGSKLTMYDPETHVVFLFEGRRLLCEKPTEGLPYAPCQFTESSTVEDVDLYTDGRVVYKSIPK